MANNNRFVWHDLNTRDVDGAKRFYGEVFNWSFDASDNGDYQHIMAGKEMIGGIRKMRPDEPGPSNWMGYVHCDDVDAFAKRIVGAKGQLYMPPMTLPDVGRFAVAADPTGGVFAPWKNAHPEEDVETDAPPNPYTFIWDELMTTDVPAAEKFYAEVFGWEAMHADFGAGDYVVFNRPGTKGPRGTPRGAGGMFKSPDGMPHSFWLSYLSVPDAAAITEKAKRLGGKVVVPPKAVAKVGTFAVWADPVGGTIGVLQPAAM